MPSSRKAHTAIALGGVVDQDATFSFPSHMPRETAEGLLAEAYGEVNAGKVLRRALKLQREEGYDPPSDVQYVSEPRLTDHADGLGVSVASDILLYEDFEGVDECVDIFEGVLSGALMERLEKKVHRWLKDHPASAPTAGGTTQRK